MNRTKAGVILICLLLFISAMIAWTEMRDQRDGIMIHVIDVGQADCMVIEAPEGNVMIDAGTDISEKQLRGYLRTHGLNKFSYLILSHPHDDHIGNADMVLDEFEVARVISADSRSEELVWKNFLASWERANEEKGTEWIKPMIGTVCHVGRLRLELLMVPQTENDGENNDSLIVRVDYGDFSMLLTGDAEAPEEELLLSTVSSEKLQADFLKVGHHGSSGSSTESFLKAVSPRWAVISCGAGNSFSHPHEELLTRLRRANIEYYRTDLYGSLRFFCDGKAIELKSVLRE